MKERKCSICGNKKMIKHFFQSSYKCKDCQKQAAANIVIDYKPDILCLPEEIWLPICGYESFHEISNFGRLSALYKSSGKSFIKLMERKILCPPINWYTGYLAHVFAQWGIYPKIKRISIHRLVALHFIPNPHNLLEVNHLDGNKVNNHFSNLGWTSRSDNIRHAFKEGLMKQRIGEDNANSKLTNEIVLKIFNSPIGPRELSRQMNMTYSLVAQIKNGSKWSHITGGNTI